MTFYPERCNIGNKYIYIPFNKTSPPTDYSPFWQQIEENIYVTTTYELDGLTFSYSASHRSIPGDYDFFGTGIRLQCSNDWTVEVKINNLESDSGFSIYESEYSENIITVRVDHSYGGKVDIYFNGCGCLSHTIRQYPPLVDTTVKIVKTGNSALMYINGILVSFGNIGYTHVHLTYDLRWIDLKVGAFQHSDYSFSDCKIAYIYAINSNMPLDCQGEPPPPPEYNIRYDNITTINKNDGNKYFYYRDLETNKKNWVKYIPE